MAMEIMKETHAAICRYFGHRVKRIHWMSEIRDSNNGLIGKKLQWHVKNNYSKIY